MMVFLMTSVLFSPTNFGIRNMASFKFSRFLKHKQPPEVFYEKKLFIEISQNSQTNTCARVSFLINLLAYFAAFGLNTEILRISPHSVRMRENRPAILLEKRPWHRCKILRHF